MHIRIRVENEWMVVTWSCCKWWILDMCSLSWSWRMVLLKMWMPLSWPIVGVMRGIWIEANKCIGKQQCFCKRYINNINDLVGLFEYLRVNNVQLGMWATYWSIVKVWKHFFFSINYCKVLLASHLINKCNFFCLNVIDFRPYMLNFPRVQTLHLKMRREMPSRGY